MIRHRRVRHLQRILAGLRQDDNGAEIVEWVIVVALLVAVAVILYNTILVSDLQSAINSIDAKVQNAIS